jgi:hypothetical protein
MTERDHDASGPRDPSLPGYALPKRTQVHTAGEVPREVSRIVFRPGPLLLFSAWFLFMAEALIVFGFRAYTQDWSSGIPWAIGMAAIGGLWVAYVLGMRIEVDDQNVSKVYLFGLLRSAIPRDRIHASSHTERVPAGPVSDEWKYERVDFESVDDDDDVWGFSVYPFLFWRSGDVAQLREVAARSEQSRVAHPIRPAASRRERLDWEYGWRFLLSAAALIMLIIGIWSATRTYLWTSLWMLNVVGGFASWVPLVGWIAYGARLRNRSILWPARVFALILTFAIPFIVWSPVPGPS